MMESHCGFCGLGPSTQAGPAYSNQVSTPPLPLLWWPHHGQAAHMLKADLA